MIDFDVSLKRGAFELQMRFVTQQASIALFGPSGSGKSTVISLLAGLLRPDSGRICIDGETLVDTQAARFVPAHRRRIGLVFQDSMLFPHLSVRANLRYSGWATGRRVSAARFDEIVAMLGIGALLTRRPSTLSGGERQRVAIGRALLAEPRLLLLDEPLASLDYARKLEILPYLARLHQTLGIPIVYVSHAVEEVARLADEVIVTGRGRILAQGGAAEVLASARTLGAAGQFAAVSVIEAQISRFDARYGMTEFDHPAGRISLPGRLGEPGTRQRILVRATDVAIAVSRPRDVSVRTLLRAQITELLTDDGPLARIELALTGGGRLVSLVTRRAVEELGLGRGDEVFAMVKATAMDERTIAFAPGRSAPDPD